MNLDHLDSSQGSPLVLADHLELANPLDVSLAEERSGSALWSL